MYFLETHNLRLETHTYTLWKCCEGHTDLGTYGRAGERNFGWGGRRRLGAGETETRPCSQHTEAFAPSRPQARAAGWGLQGRTCFPHFQPQRQLLTRLGSWLLPPPSEPATADRAALTAPHGHPPESHPRRPLLCPPWRPSLRTLVIPQWAHLSSPAHSPSLSSAD